MDTTPTHIAVAGTLGKEYEPARELICGQLVTKPAETSEHREMERRFLRLLESYEQRGLGRALPEMSVHHEGDVRIPDVVFCRPDARLENDILLDPPLLCIEILSPPQQPSDLYKRCEAYHIGAVPYCWVVDPAQQAIWEYHREAPARLVPKDGIARAGDFIAIPWTDIFSNP